MDLILKIFADILIFGAAILFIIAIQIIHKQQNKIEELNKVIQRLLVIEITKQNRKGG